MVRLVLPGFAPVPPANLRSSISSKEWEACLDSWIFIINHRLRMSQEDFLAVAPKDVSAISFLKSYVRESRAFASESDDETPTASKLKILRRSTYLLVRRCLLELSPPPEELLDWTFLGELCAHYRPGSRATGFLLTEVWARNAQRITHSIEKAKALAIKQLSSSDPTADNEAEGHLMCLAHLACHLPAAGQVLMTGSDYIDTLFEAYKTKNNDRFRKSLVTNVYIGFTSLLKLQPPSVSLLLDQLFSLKAAADTDSKTAATMEPTLLSDLVCSSNLLSRMQRLFADNPQKRADNITSSLRTYRAEFKHLHTPRRRPKRKDKGKGRAAEVVHEGEIHMHRMSLITQIEDLFPNLGSGYIARLLDHTSDNVETVISHLLENTLPDSLRDLDPSEQLNGVTLSPDLVPKPTPSPPLQVKPSAPIVRKNVFDDDEFDRLEISPSQVRFGRANPDLTADEILANKSSHGVNKAAILSALAAFDSDDDERDDTYDVADVGGTVDSVPPGTDADANADLRRDDANEVTLYNVYKSNPKIFGRDSTTRRSAEREVLRKNTGMTDEAIEGWAVMLVREPKRMSKMERIYALSAGQTLLPSSAYRKSAEAGAMTGTEESEDEEESGEAPGTGGSAGSNRVATGSRGGRGGTRGRGRGRGIGGDPAAGKDAGQNTAQARRRKDANKASRANHNRRNQRAKKMARGGL